MMFEGPYVLTANFPYFTFIKHIVIRTRNKSTVLFNKWVD